MRALLKLRERTPTGTFHVPNANRYTDFGSYTKTFGLATSCSSGCSSPSSSVSIDLKESFHTFRVGLAFDL